MADDVAKRPGRSQAGSRRRLALMVIAALTSCSAAAAAQNPRNSYDVLLHSSSLSEQRAALATVLATPSEYVPRIRQTLQTYAKQLGKNRMAANRGVYVAALVRDPLFIPILVKLLSHPKVLSECLYSCAPVFALSVYANFGGWTIPASLNANLATVNDLRSSMQWVPRLTLETRPLEGAVRGPGVPAHRAAIEAKSEEQLIEMAGPATSSLDTREFAAFGLKTSVSRSTIRVDIYLLAMNDIQDDASREYLGAVHTAAYRAELARAKGQ
jgi:hypothetical protein